MKPITTVTIVILLLVAFVHFLRLLLNWEVVVNGTVLPLWTSTAGLVLALALAVLLGWENRR